ncbi:hypothetical protein HN011_005975 [Eciton burchellii]|nr:hypothetical protein HN011_005975 [Eciton burchellii]
MDSRTFMTITLVFTLFALFHSGEALKCYECNSKDDKNCFNNLTSNQEKTCPILQYFCISCRMDTKDGNAIVRGCMSSELKSFQESIECKICNTDLCNSSNALSTNVLTLGWFVLLWVIRFIYTY